MDTSADRWEIEQDEFGRPLVRHRHVVDSIPCYVSKDADGNRKAWCPGCQAQIRLEDTSPMSILGALSQAWESAEASLPLECRLAGLVDITLAPYAGFAVEPPGEPARWAAIAATEGQERTMEVGWGEHPAEALNRLADQLRELRGTTTG
jgi:hypothetical protein